MLHNLKLYFVDKALDTRFEPTGWKYRFFSRMVRFLDKFD